MLRNLIAAGCLSLITAAACQPASTPTTPPEAEPATAGDSAHVPSEPKPRAVPTPEHAGVAHTSNIDRIAMCPDATCVMTRDNVGGLRLWPALDGSAEPQPIPVRSASAFSAARAGKHWTVFVVEASGGARIFSVAEDGKADELAMLPPFNPILRGYVLPGGKRVLTLFKDGSIRIISKRGKELVKFDERRFHPKVLRVGANGRHFTAALGVEQQPGEFRVEVQRMAIGGSNDAPTIKRDGPPRVVTSTVAIDQATAVMSTDARRFAVAKKGVGDKWEIAIYDLTKDVEPEIHLVKTPAHIVPHLGFVAASTLIVSSNQGTLSWLLDLKSGDVRARSAIPQDFTHQGKVQVSGPGRQVVGYGTWVFVQDVEARRHRFLGYKAAQGAGVAISPTGKHVAWAYTGGPVFIERLGGTAADTERLQLPPTAGLMKVRFVDEDHLAIVDGIGGVHLFHWSSQELIDQAGVMGSIRSVQMDPTSGLLLIDRHNNDASLFEVSDEGFEGPYIVADQAYRLGLLSPKPPSAEILWTLDGGNKLRTYTLDELRKDLTRQQVDQMGEVLKSGQPAPLAIDRAGQHYGIRWNGAQLELFVGQGKDLDTKPVPNGDVNQIVPAPNGQRFLVVFNRAGAISLSAHATKKLTPLWSYSTGVFNNDVNWSEDGELVGVAAATGAILLDATTGDVVRRRCGLEFSSVSSPPANAFANSGQRSLCEI